MRKIAALISLLSTFAFAAFAAGATIDVDPIDYSGPAGGTATLTVPGYDGSAGALESVEVTVNAALSADIEVTNDTGATQLVPVSLISGSTSVSSSTTINFTIGLAGATTANVDAMSTHDFGTVTAGPDVGSQEVSADPAFHSDWDLALSSGGGWAIFAAGVTSSITDFEQQGTVHVRYNTVPEPASLAMLVVLVVGGAQLRRGR